MRSDRDRTLTASRRQRESCASAGHIRSSGAPENTDAKHWDARLDLGFERRGPRSLLTRCEHDGPLVVQKPLYPEGEAVCQCIVIHPPGGIAGGDRLALDVRAEADAIAQLATPGAAKWYRSAGDEATQTLGIKVDRGAAVEWLPQGAIVFNEARAALDTHVELADGAAFIGWDIACLGRVASGETFARGSFRQQFEIVSEGALVWSERAHFEGGSRLLGSPAGLNGEPVFGTFVAIGREIEREVLDRCRAIACKRGDGAVTRLPEVVVGRYRGTSLEDAHRYFASLWSLLRPWVLGREAVPPRIWAT